MFAAAKSFDYSARPAPLNLNSPDGVYVTPLHEYQTSAMDEETSRLFLGLMLNFAPGSDEAIDSLKPELEKEFAYKVLSGRLEYSGLEVDFNVKAFLAMTFPNPGNLVMFVHSIYHSQFRVEGESFSMADFTNTYPMGFPDETVMNYAWDSQKTNGQPGNALDLYPVFAATPGAPYREPKATSLSLPGM